jgi:uncharacterized protein YbdZ (MbtH family)
VKKEGARHERLKDIEGVWADMLPSSIRSTAEKLDLIILAEARTR